MIVFDGSKVDGSKSDDSPSRRFCDAVLRDRARKRDAAVDYINIGCRVYLFLVTSTTMVL